MQPFAVNFLLPSFRSPVGPFGMDSCLVLPPPPGVSFALALAMFLAALVENLSVNWYFHILYRMSLHIKVCELCVCLSMPGYDKWGEAKNTVRMLAGMLSFEATMRCLLVILPPC